MESETLSLVHINELRKRGNKGFELELKFELAEKDSRAIVTRVKVAWQKKTETGFLTGVKIDTD